MADFGIRNNCTTFAPLKCFLSLTIQSMKRKKKYLICYCILFVISFVFIPLFALFSGMIATCYASFNGDEVEKLLDGYVYNISKSSIYKNDDKQICDVIPSPINNYCQTEYYILARQDSVNYWILNKETNSVEGPLCKADFDKKCELYDAEYAEGPYGSSSTYPFLIHKNRLIFWPTALFLFVVLYLCSNKLETFVGKFKYEVITALGIATNVALCIFCPVDINTKHLIVAFWIMIVTELAAIQYLKRQWENFIIILSVAFAYLVVDYVLLIIFYLLVVGLILLSSIV